MTAPDLHAIVLASLLVPSPLERYRPTPLRSAVHGDLILMANGEPGLDGNLASVVGPLEPSRVFALAESFFQGEPYVALVEVERAGRMDEALRQAGWELEEEEPALALTPIPAIPPKPDGLAIRRVVDERSLEAFFQLSGTGRRHIPSLAAALDHDVALLVGYVEGRPVATSRVSCLGEVGDVTGVVTDPAFRRRGFGTAMTWAAVAAAVSRGCTAMTLTATELGYPVYVRMGFEPVCTFRGYVPPGTVELSGEQ